MWIFQSYCWYCPVAFSLLQIVGTPRFLVAATHRHLCSPNCLQEMNKPFKNADKDMAYAFKLFANESGFLSEKEITNIMTSLGESLTASEVSGSPSSFLSFVVDVFVCSLVIYCINTTVPEIFSFYFLLSFFLTIQK